MNNTVEKWLKFSSFFQNKMTLVYKLNIFNWYFIANT